MSRSSGMRSVSPGGALPRAVSACALAPQCRPSPVTSAAAASGAPRTLCRFGGRPPPFFRGASLPGCLSLYCPFVLCCGGSCWRPPERPAWSTAAGRLSGAVLPRPQLPVAEQPSRCRPSGSPAGLTSSDLGAGSPSLSANAAPRQLDDLAAELSDSLAAASRSSVTLACPRATPGLRDPRHGRAPSAPPRTRPHSRPMRKVDPSSVTLELGSPPFDEGPLPFASTYGSSAFLG